MRSNIITAEDGTFIIPGGHFGFQLVPTARRQTIVAPALMWANGPVFGGTPGEFPVTLEALDSSGGEALTIVNSDVFSDTAPLPAYKVTGAEPGSVWRLVTLDRAGERVTPSPQRALGLLDLGSVQTGAYAASETQIRLRPCYRALHLYGVESETPVPTLELLIVHESQGGNGQYRHRYVALSTTDATGLTLNIPSDIPAGGRLGLQHLDASGPHVVRVCASFEVG